MSFWKKLTGHSWKRMHKPLIYAGAAVGAALTGGAIAGMVGAGALSGSAALAGATSSGALASAAVGGVAGAATGNQADQQERDAARAAREAEDAAGSGHVVETQEATATVDTAGNTAYKRRQAALAAGYGTGRGGTRITSSLGGSGKLG